MNLDASQPVSAPASWQTVDFISDLHLQASCPRTLAAFEAYLAQTPADALFILGDLFEVWVGDDCLGGVKDADPFAAHCAAILQAASRRMQLFIMVGNRDFLMGQRCMHACGAQALADPAVLDFCDQRWLLTHGDALCLDDLPYQQFRAQVRSPQWQAEFLAKPLAERQRIAREIRTHSENNKRQAAQNALIYADLDTKACIALLHRHEARHMINGHTHQPATHQLDAEKTRTVLSDWDGEAPTPRADILRLSREHKSGRGLQRLSPF